MRYRNQHLDQRAPPPPAGAARPTAAKEGANGTGPTAARFFCVLLLFGGENPTEAQQAQTQVRTFVRFFINLRDKHRSVAGSKWVTVV